MKQSEFATILTTILGLLASLVLLMKFVFFRFSMTMLSMLFEEKNRLYFRSNKYASSLKTSTTFHIRLFVLPNGQTILHRNLQSLTRVNISQRRQDGEQVKLQLTQGRQFERHLV